MAVLGAASWEPASLPACLTQTTALLTQRLLFLRLQGLGC